jgi:hypothetical protein
MGRRLIVDVRYQEDVMSNEEQWTIVEASYLHRGNRSALARSPYPEEFTRSQNDSFFHVIH